MRAAESLAPAGASALFMISASTWIAALPCARASAEMSVGMSCLSVTMENQ
jgi:hypothetical protein